MVHSIIALRYPLTSCPTRTPLATWQYDTREGQRSRNIQPGLLNSLPVPPAAARRHGSAMGRAPWEASEAIVAISGHAAVAAAPAEGASDGSTLDNPVHLDSTINMWTEEACVLLREL